jgi:hypothetical protein
MTTNEIIKQIAVYDGWEIHTSYSRRGYVLRNGNELIKGTYLLPKQNEMDNPILRQYLTDLNILHRVAVKVYNEFRDLCDIVDKYHDVRFNMFNAFYQEPINGEYITLATATAEAIIYLKKYKV